MRVLQLGPYPPPHGGVQTNLVAIREHLKSLGIPCSAINLTRFRRPDDSGVYYPRNAMQVVQLLLRLRHDVIHLHIGGNVTPRLLGLCFLCSLIPWARTVLTLHSGGYPSSDAGRKARPTSVRGFVFRRLDRVIAVNSAIVNLFSDYGMPPEKIRLIPPYTEVPVISDEELPEPLRGFLGTHGPVLLTVSHLEPEYDLPSQIEVLGLVRERFPGAGLVIIGAGSLKDEIRRLIDSKPYRDHILLCGDVPHPAALRAIFQCDLFLRTTHYDGDSISVREALQLQVPVIATDNGMRPEEVHLVPMGDLSALRRTIERLLRLPRAPRKRRGSEGARNMEAVVSLYRELIQ